MVNQIILLKVIACCLWPIQVKPREQLMDVLIPGILGNGAGNIAVGTRGAMCLVPT
jgi:hypothetical protein